MVKSLFKCPWRIYILAKKKGLSELTGSIEVKQDCGTAGTHTEPGGVTGVGGRSQADLGAWLLDGCGEQS